MAPDCEKSFWAGGVTIYDGVGRMGKRVSGVKMCFWYDFVYVAST